MNILYLPAYFYPDKAASGFLSEHKSQAFAEAGNTINAYVPTPCRGISNEERKKLF